jgi:hypothetical protein
MCAPVSGTVDMWGNFPINILKVQIPFELEILLVVINTVGTLMSGHKYVFS